MPLRENNFFTLRDGFFTHINLGRNVYKNRYISRFMDEEIRSWLDQAIHDLKSAKDSSLAGNYDWACFQAQQGAEKSLKALYLKQFHDLRKVHDLFFLATRVNAPSEILEACAWLNNVYIDSRYPDAEWRIPAIKFSEDDSRRALKLAEAVTTWVKKKL